MKTYCAKMPSENSIDCFLSLHTSTVSIDSRSKKNNQKRRMLKTITRAADHDESTLEFLISLSGINPSSFWFKESQTSRGQARNRSDIDGGRNLPSTTRKVNCAHCKRIKILMWP